MMLPALALTLTEEQWHYLTCLGTARLGKAETPVLMGPALPAEPDPLAPWHMAITWQPDAGRRSPGTLLRPSPAGLSFTFRPESPSPRACRSRPVIRLNCLVPPSRDEWLRPGVRGCGTKLCWRPGQAVSYSRRPNTSTAHDTVLVTLRPLAPHHPNNLHTLRLCDGTPLSCNAQRLHRAISANATANKPISISLLRRRSRLAHQPFSVCIYICICTCTCIWITAIPARAPSDGPV